MILFILSLNKKEKSSKKHVSFESPELHSFLFMLLVQNNSKSNFRDTCKSDFKNQKRYIFSYLRKLASTGGKDR